MSIAGERQNEWMGRSLLRPKVDMSGLCGFCGERWKCCQGDALACHTEQSGVLESWPPHREAGTVL